MKLSEFIKKHQQDIFAIKESRNGKFVSYHTVFGWCDEDNYFYMGNGYTNSISIPDQKMEILKNNEVRVDAMLYTLTKVELTFYKATPIEIK